MRSLLVLVLAVGIPCSWLAVARQQVKRQREAVEAIRKAGGWVDYEEAETPVPTWLRELLGDDFFLKLHAVDFHDKQVTDAGLQHLKALSSLQTLDLIDTQVTDAGINELKKALPNCSIPH
jgi:hypothetical protein